MTAHLFTDAAALSAALMSLRPRARTSVGMRCSTEVPALGTVTWVCSEAGTGTFARMEAVGITLAEPIPEDTRFNRQAFVDLLPEELVPTKVSESGQRIAFSFRVTPGHFRCRDCRWGDATNERGTHPGLCADCAGKRSPKGVFPAPVSAEATP